MVIYSYPVKKKRKISYSLSLYGSFLMFWTLLGLGRDNKPTKHPLIALSFLENSTFNIKGVAHATININN